MTKSRAPWPPRKPPPGRAGRPLQLHGRRGAARCRSRRHRGERRADGASADRAARAHPPPRRRPTGERSPSGAPHAGAVRRGASAAVAATGGRAGAGAAAALGSGSGGARAGGAGRPDGAAGVSGASASGLRRPATGRSGAGDGAPPAPPAPQRDDPEAAGRGRPAGGGASAARAGAHSGRRPNRTGSIRRVSGREGYWRADLTVGGTPYRATGSSPEAAWGRLQEKVAAAGGSAARRRAAGGDHRRGLRAGLARAAPAGDWAGPRGAELGQPRARGQPAPAAGHRAPDARRACCVNTQCDFRGIVAS